jgi:hypothetical protein
MQKGRLISRFEFPDAVLDRAFCGESDEMTRAVEAGLRRELLRVSKMSQGRISIRLKQNAVPSETGSNLLDTIASAKKEGRSTELRAMSPAPIVFGILEPETVKQTVAPATPASITPRLSRRYSRWYRLQGT